MFPFFEIFCPFPGILSQAGTVILACQSLTGFYASVLCLYGTGFALSFAQHDSLDA